MTTLSTLMLLVVVGMVTYSVPLFRRIYLNLEVLTDKTGHILKKIEEKISLNDCIIKHSPHPSASSPITASTTSRRFDQVRTSTTHSMLNWSLGGSFLSTPLHAPLKSKVLNNFWHLESCVFGRSSVVPCKSHCGLTYYSTALALRVVLPKLVELLCHNFASYFKTILICNSVNISHSRIYIVKRWLPTASTKISWALM